MKRSRLYLNFLILIFLFNIIFPSVSATNYVSGIYEDQELTWKCNVCNQIEMESIFGDNWDDFGIFNNLSQGKSMKWKINYIIVNETKININFSIWEWRFENIWGLKDYDSELSYLRNPGDYSQAINFSQYSSFVPFLFPIPIGEYIGGLDLINWYDVDNRVLPTLNVKINKNGISPGIPSKNIKVIAIYNDQGILNSYKLYITGNIVIIDLSLDFLPFYVIPTLIGLFIGFSLGIILYLIKRRNSKIGLKQKRG